MGTGIKVKYLLTILLSLILSRSYAQDLRFTASSSSSQVGTGEQFEVSFSLNGDGDRFSPPGFEGFEVLSGPNVSNSMTSINGNTTVSNSITYILTAIKEGSFTIGSATITAGGRRLSTGPLRIKVVKGNRSPQQSSRQQSPYSGSGASGEADLSKTLLIRAVPSHTTVYQGQQLVLSYKLYTRVGIVDTRLDKLPDLTGFWNEEVKNNQQQAQWRVETYKGQKYNVADVRQSILIPERSGELRIEPFVMSFIARVQEPSNDIMDQFFGSSYQDVKYTAKSLPVVIHVKPLPTAGRPAGYSGAVGNFTINANSDKTEIRANEAINYKVVISGAGNLRLLKAPVIQFPENFEKYDPKETDSVEQNITGARGKKIFNYLLIPRREGDYRLEPLLFSYFNPVSGRYVSISSKAYKIKVNKGAAEQNVTVYAPSDLNGSGTDDKDIRTIKKGNPGLHPIGRAFYESPWYIVILAIGPACCLIAFILRNRNRVRNSDMVKVKSRKAGRQASKHLSHAAKHLGNPSEFYNAVFKGLNGYLSDKLNIPLANLSKDSISAKLKQRGVGEIIRNLLLETLDTCEMARYSPVKSVSEREVLDNANKIINTIEDEIR